MRAAPGKRDELVELCRESVPRALRGGCKACRILFDTDDPDLVVMVERWPSEQAFRRFAAEEQVDDALMARYFAVAVGMPELRRLRALD